MAEKRKRNLPIVSGRRGERERFELRRKTQEELNRTLNKISELKKGMVWVDKKIRQCQKKAEPLSVLLSEELAISGAAKHRARAGGQ
ncbi:Protein of unknown function [Gryllus bimaculatus]|nr:Protein of unknown function [Gryllus bimaculatus]